jgi:hypothetical protein
MLMSAIVFLYSVVLAIIELDTARRRSFHFQLLANEFRYLRVTLDHTSFIALLAFEVDATGIHDVLVEFELVLALLAKPTRQPLVLG